MSASRLFPFVVVSVLSACATSRYAGLAHGQPEPASDLSVAPVTEQVPQLRVTELEDAAGVSVGREVTVVGYRTVVAGFSLRKGNENIDEQDYYELARDRDGLDAVERARARGKIMNRTGIALVIAGTASAIAAPIVLGRGAAPYAVGQWFLTFPVGLALTMFGKRPFERHVLPVTRAFGAIDRAPEPWATNL